MCDPYTQIKFYVQGLKFISLLFLPVFSKKFIFQFLQIQAAAACNVPTDIFIELSLTKIFYSQHLLMYLANKTFSFPCYKKNYFMRPLWKYPQSNYIHLQSYILVDVSVLFHFQRLSMRVGFIYYYFENNLERRNPLMNKIFLQDATPRIYGVIVIGILTESI